MCNKVYKTIVPEACISLKCLSQPSGQKRVSGRIDAFHFNHISDLRGDGRGLASACACEDQGRGWRKKPAKLLGLGAIPWTENEIRSMEDLGRQINTHILIDDLRSTIIGWKSKDALMVSEVANAGGKKNNQIDITTQRIPNFVPPDLMMLCDEILVPWIVKADLTRASPRGPNKGVPLEIVPLKFTAGYEFLGIDHTFKYDNETGDKILSGFNTLQIANGLKERGEVKNDSETKSVAYCAHTEHPGSAPEGFWFN